MDPKGIRRNGMGLILVVLLLALAFGGLGFIFPILWIIAVVFFVVLATGFGHNRRRPSAT
jgi:hypothetical protein